MNRKYAILGFALVEAIALFALMIALLLIVFLEVYKNNHIKVVTGNTKDE